MPVKRLKGGEGGGGGTFPYLPPPAAAAPFKRQFALLYCRPYYLLLKKALYLGVNEFSTKALIGDTIFTSPTGDGTATESREGLAICRVKAVPSFLSHFKTLSVGSVPGI